MPDKILIVDDEQTITRLLEIQLRREGYATVVANNGPDALSKVIAEKPDLVILDVMMPGMDGVEVCRHLRSQPATARLPIIMASAKTQTGDKIAGLRAGADEYVTKPMDMAEVVVRVEMLLKRTRQLSEIPTVRRGKVLGFVGAKGGVGATTAAISVAALLSQQNKSVILLEIREQFGTMALQLKKTPAQTLADLAALEPARINGQTLGRALEIIGPGMRALFGPQDWEQRPPLSAEHVEALITQAALEADYVVVDLPSLSCAANQAAVQSCDRVVLVVEPETICVASAKVALGMLATWMTSASASAGVLSINRSGMTSTMSMRDIQSRLGFIVIGSMPFASEACIAAQAQGMPVALFRPDALAAKGLRDLTDRLTAETLVGMAL
jgi:DNA-binding response OmpR family regulator